MSEFEAESPAEERCRFIVERTDAEIARLTSERDEALGANTLNRNALARAKARVAELEAALSPFAVAHIQSVEADHDPNHTVCCNKHPAYYVSRGHFERAMKALGS